MIFLYHFQTHNAIRPVLTDNHVAGCERAGFKVNGEPCTHDINSAEPWSGNVAHSVLTGVTLFADQGVAGCSLIRDFTVYKAFDYGLYYQSESNLEVIDFTSIDNNLGLFPMVVKPAALGHAFADKWVHVSNSSFVGTSSSFDCNTDVSPGGPNIILSAQARSWRSPGGGKIGIAFPTFSSSSNKAPQKAFNGIKSYQAIRGLMTVRGKPYYKEVRHSLTIISRFRVTPKTSTTIFETIFLSDRMATRVSLSVDVHGIDVVILIDFKMSYCVL